MKRTVYVLCLLLASFSTWAQKKKAIDPVEQMKSKVLQLVQGKEKNVQEMVDMVFSFGELGFQEVETSKYLTNLLEKNGFQVERGVAGIPTASLIAGPNYLYDEADTLDKIAKDQLVPVTKFFAELVEAMDATPSALIGVGIAAPQLPKVP